MLCTRVVNPWHVGLDVTLGIIESLGHAIGSVAVSAEGILGFLTIFEASEAMEEFDIDTPLAELRRLIRTTRLVLKCRGQGLFAKARALTLCSAFRE